MSLTLLVLFSTGFSTIVSEEFDFYWRPIRNTSDVPKDALIVASDGVTKVYIGRAPYMNYGNFIGPILTGQNGTVVTYVGSIYYAYNFIEIFCSTSIEKFVWVPATYKTLLGIPGLVLGGYEVQRTNMIPGVLYIGRTINTTLPNVGKVVGFNSDGGEYFNMLYAAGRTSEEFHEKFEVLTFDHKKFN